MPPHPQRLAICSPRQPVPACGQWSRRCPGRRLVRAWPGAVPPAPLSPPDQRLAGRRCPRALIFARRSAQSHVSRSFLTRRMRAQGQLERAPGCPGCPDLRSERGLASPSSSEGAETTRRFQIHRYPGNAARNKLCDIDEKHFPEPIRSNRGSQLPAFVGAIASVGRSTSCGIAFPRPRFGVEARPRYSPSPPTPPPRGDRGRSVAVLTLSFAPSFCSMLASITVSCWQWAFRVLRSSASSSEEISPAVRVSGAPQ